MPTYAMSIFVFPKNICHKIDASCRKFWWGVNKNGNALMLKSWDSICKPKSAGGLGFKRAFDMNMALMAKLAWAITADHNCIWIKLIKSKYLRGKSFLNDNLSLAGGSWIWADICHCRDTIKAGAIYTINANSNILIWTEPWIPTHPSFIPLINNMNPNSLVLSLVRDLINQSSCSWNIQSLTATFSPDLIKEILKIQISPSDRPKTLVWSPSLSGIFSSKSVYLSSQMARFNHSSILPPTVWNKIWNSKLHNRLKLMLWRILNKALPCKDKIDLFILFNALLFDNIWRYRNSLAHGGPSMTVQDLVSTISKQSQSHWFSTVQTAQSGSSANHIWKPPPSGWKKINVDAAFKNDVTFNGMVLKNEDGSIQLAAITSHHCSDAITAETLAILDACYTLIKYQGCKSDY
ncbi:hypothetical protein CASFOL_040682 [Castilleja foliolosa]|uniref:RNase H type-1 domain-containing protein n=1 Tax=Castilleja foliolosa TaxID=1961234 RepID=A0ABD3BCA5_9LAMI